MIRKAKKKAEAKPDPEAAAEAPLPVLVGNPPCDEADQATLNAAGLVYEHLLTRVKDFQDTLPKDYELGIQLANFGGERAMHVRGMGYRNPNIIEFYGLLDGATQVAVVQHVSQLNFMMVAVPPPATGDEPYRIGFGAEI
ncbi:MAG: DUF6173 family protein [Paracoccus sp. (in: a-proteobacteria)]